MRASYEILWTLGALRRASGAAPRHFSPRIVRSSPAECQSLRLSSIGLENGTADAVRGVLPINPSPMRLVYALSLFALLAATAAAQPAALRGRVLERGTADPVVGASVVLRLPGETAPAAGTAADAEGRFTVPEITPGRYRLVVSAVGSAPFEETLGLEAGARIERRIELRPAASDLDEVVVEAGRPGGVRDATAGAQRAEAENIALIPVPGGGGDLAAYLQPFPASPPSASAAGSSSCAAASRRRTWP